MSESAGRGRTGARYSGAMARGPASHGVRLSVAAVHPRVSVNDLTDDQAVDELSGNAAFNGVPVRVGAAAGTRVPR